MALEDAVFYIENAMENLTLSDPYPTCEQMVLKNSRWLKVFTLCSPRPAAHRQCHSVGQNDAGATRSKKDLNRLNNH